MVKSVTDWFEASAEKNPAKYAVTDGEKSYTYAQLERLTACAAAALCSLGVFREPVGVYMEKSADALAAQLSAARAGACYCSLNTELPDARLRAMADVLSPAVIVTSKPLFARAKEVFPLSRVVAIESLCARSGDKKALDEVKQRRTDTDALYVNFTSGSTGTPKGIVVPHRSVIDFIGCFTEVFGITDADVLANQAPFDFDVSVKDIYSAFKVGATVAVIPRRLFSAPTELIDFLCDSKATALIWAVSALCLLTTFHALDYKTPETINKVLFSGEVMPTKALAQLRTRLPEAMFVNLYGPTEITCNCTYHILESGRDYSLGIPIGKAFENEDVFLLSDADALITAPDEVGEICVRGTALALGYIGAPQAQAEHFVQNPLNRRYTETIYRTGDLARYNERGELVFCGRKDFQIKYMGHRIELEEIERAIAALSGVERACCIFDEKRQRLRGFFIGTADAAEVHAEMKRTMPAFTVPGVIKRLDAFPLNKNGKVDRRQLAELTGRN